MNNLPTVSRETAKDLVRNLYSYYKTFKRQLSPEFNDEISALLDKAEDELYPTYSTNDIVKLPNLTQHAKELMDFVKETPTNASYINNVPILEGLDYNKD